MIHLLKTQLRNYRSPLLIALVSVIGIFGYAHVSYASNVVTEGLLAAAGGLAGFFTHWLVVLVNTIASKVLLVISLLVDFGLRLNETVISEGIVPVGWKIARDVANLGFTVGLIAISFATILRMEQYGAKKLLGKLVIVALLINFSLLIPGVILDATNVFSHFFLSKIVGGAVVVDGERIEAGGLASLSAMLATSMKVSGFADIKAGADNALSVENLADVIKIVVGGIFIIFFQVLAAIAMGGVAYMIFYRYLVLIFLFIVAPLAWISLFLPAFGSLWKKWWDEFFKWALFLPAMTFFLYLTVLAASNNTLGNAINSAMTPYNGINDLVDIIPVAAQMAVLIGLIFGSLIVAQKFSIAGAEATISAATGARKVMLGAITGAVVGPAKYFGARPVKEGATALASLLNKPILRWIPGMKGAVAGLNQFGQRQEEIDAYQKKYLSKKALPDEEFKKVLKGRLPEGPVARAALLAEAASRGLLKEIKDDPKKLLALASAAEETTPGTETKDVKDIQSILGIMPSLASQITDGKLTTYEAARRYVSADKAHDLTPEELGNASVIASFTQGHWKDLVENPKTSAEQMIAAQSALKELAGDDLVKLQQDYAVAQMQIDRAKQEGMQEGDKKIKNADGTFTYVKGLKSLRKDLMKPLNERRDALFTKTSTVTGDDRKHYTPVINDRRMNEPKFIANFKAQYGHEPTNEELILIERGRTYKQLEDSQKQIGGLFYRPYNPKAGGGGPLPPGGPGGGPGGGAPSGPAGGPGGAPPPPVPPTPPPTPPGGPTPPPPPAGGGPGAPPRVPPTGPTAPPPPSGPTNVEELRTRAERAGGGVAPAGPTPPLPPAGSAPVRPAPQPRPSGAPAAGRYERTPAEEAEIASAIEELKKERAREAAKTPPRTVEGLRTRAEEAGGGTAPAGRPAPLPKEKETRGADEAERRARAEEEARLKAAEKSAEAAARGAEAAKKELESREAALGVTKETGKETEKILREVEGGAAAAKKAVQEFATLNLRGREDFTKAFMIGDVNEWKDAEITTPDNRKRIVKSIARNSPNPMQTTIRTEEDENIDLNQLFKFAEKANVPIVVKKVKKT